MSFINREIFICLKQNNENELFPKFSKTLLKDENEILNENI